ncbi:Plcxd1 [Symbiodinium pilosum]|uniref:Plcxd1 protein n=1 Tax=Symbiodinium pilosum TaxID=2952 RepID=A0A812IMC8_SYMPI|nr:Plcxd1 [Symbiodinium pilosum]
MLDGGIRFIDFRIMYSVGPDRLVGTKDWYCLHGCESKHKAIDYLRHVRSWMDSHPKEIVVFWASRHGNEAITGTAQYPGTTPAERQAFFKQVEEVFGELLIANISLNETTVAELQTRNQRLLWFASDYAESTGSSPKALDARSLDNQLKGGGYGKKFVDFMKQGSAKLQEDRAQNKFLLVSMSGGPADTAVTDAAKLEFLPDLFGTHKKWTKECATSSSIPNMTSWCPGSLMDWALLDNYYQQRALDLIFKLGDTDAQADFPNAIYINAVDMGGLIRTGTAKINPLDEELGSTAADHATDGYAYSATLIAANIRRLCRVKQLQGCEDLGAAAAAARALHPVSLWDDAKRGRLSDWPPLDGSFREAPAEVMATLRFI